MMVDDSVAPWQGLLSFRMIYPEFRYAPLRALVPAHPPGAMAGWLRMPWRVGGEWQFRAHCVQRRRREGIQPGVQRSETPRGPMHATLQPLSRGDGK
jgi:hypothetical protein